MSVTVVTVHFNIEEVLIVEEQPMKLIPIEWSQQRILTTEQIARSYGTTPEVLLRNFQRNFHRYTEGKHYYRLEGDLLKAFLANLDLQKESNDDLASDNLSPASDESLLLTIGKRTTILYLWTEKGAWLLAKSLNTDKAWQACENLVDDYYRRGDQLLLLQEQLGQAQQEVLQLRQREQKLLPERITDNQAYEIIGQIGDLIQKEEIIPEMKAVDRYNLEFALHKAQAYMRKRQYQWVSPKAKDGYFPILEYPDETPEEKDARQRQEKAIRDREKNKAPEVIEKALMEYLKDFGPADIYDFKSVIDAHRHLIEATLKDLEGRGIIQRWTEGNEPMYILVEEYNRLAAEAKRRQK